MHTFADATGRVDGHKGGWYASSADGTLLVGALRSALAELRCAAIAQ